MLQELLKVEVRDFVLVGAVQKLLQGSVLVGLDDALVLGVREVLGLHILVNLTGDIGAGLLSALGDTQEDAELVRNLGRLGKTVGGGAGIGALALNAVRDATKAVHVLLHNLDLGDNLLEENGKGGELLLKENHGRLNNLLSIGSGGRGGGLLGLNGGRLLGLSDGFVGLDDRLLGLNGGGGNSSGGGFLGRHLLRWGC